MAKHNVIWKSYGMYSSKELEDYEKDVKEWLEEDAVENITEETITDEVYFQIDVLFQDAELNLSKKLDGRIIAIADMGLWYGRRQGYKILERNLNEVVSSTIGCDEKEVYCDAYNVRAEGYHHDGTNHVLFRELREDRNIDNFLEKIYNNETISSSTLNYYTKSLRPYIKAIYGF